jgi:pimeloyl-ACP methyl ester carboxylesterase
MGLAYKRAGAADGPAIVFVHGMAMGSWMWGEQTAHFSDYDCYSVDLPGHGGSRQIAWESFDQAADAVAEVITAEIGDKPVYLVGMSLGAMVGLHMLVRHPGRIKRAVLTGALAAAPPRWMTLLQGNVLAALLPTALGQQLFARMLQLPPEAMPEYVEGIRGLSIQDFRRMVGQIANYSAPRGLEGIGVPVLFVTGEHDAASTRQSVAVLAGRMPGAVGLYAPGVHHGWNGEDPALFNAMMRAWIEEKALPEGMLPARN